MARKRQNNEVALADRPIQEILERLVLTPPEGAAAREKERERILHGLASAAAYTPLGIELSGVWRSITSLIEAYFSSMLAERYPQISGELLGLERAVTINADGRQFRANIPVFAVVRYGVEDYWEKSYTAKDENGREYNATISSKTPMPTAEVREKAKEAIAFCHELKSRALRVPVLGDYLIAYRGESYIVRSTGKEAERKMTAAVPRPQTASLKVLWKPNPSELSTKLRVIDRDPILALQWENHLYLVETWNIPEEEPFMHYLKEFKL